MIVQHTACDEAVRCSLLREQFWTLPQFSRAVLREAQSTCGIVFTLLIEISDKLEHIATFSVSAQWFVTQASV